MFDKERELVEIGSHSYNLKQGGEGGFDYINQNGLTKCNFTIEGRMHGRQRQKELGITSMRHKRGDFQKIYFGTDIEKTQRAISRAQSDEAKKKRKETLSKTGHQQGSKNSQYGTMWITNGESNRKIKADVQIPEGFRKGRK